LGHHVRLIAPAYVKPFIKRQKNDAADAEAICEAAQRPSMRFVPVKTEEQQANGIVFRARDLLVRQRTQCVNALRGHLMEYGYIFPKGITHVATLVALVEDGAATGATDAGGAFPVSKGAVPTKARPCPPSSTARRMTISSWRTILESFVVEPEFLLQPPIADPLPQAQQPCDEGQGLRECSYGVPLFGNQDSPGWTAQTAAPASTRSPSGLSYNLNLPVNDPLLSIWTSPAAKSGGPESTLPRRSRG
jgi:Transposase